MYPDEERDHTVFAGHLAGQLIFLCAAHPHLLCSLLLSDLNTETILLDLVNYLGDKHWKVETLKSPIPLFTYNH